MNLQKFRPSKNSDRANSSESYLPPENPKKIGNPPIEDLTRWEEDGGTVIYDCFVADQSFQPHDEDLSSDKGY